MSHVAQTIRLCGRRILGLFTKPGPRRRKLDLSVYHKHQGPRSGMNAILGRWPGDETDEEVQAALDRLS